MVVAVLSATLVCLALVERFARANATRTASSALTQIAWQMRDQLDRGMADCYEDANVLAGLRELRPDASSDDARSLLNQARVSYPRIAWAGWTDAQGVVLASSDGLLEGQNVSSRPWFAGGVKGAFVGDVHDAVLLAKLLPKQDEPWRFVDIAVPIRDSSGEVRNVLGIHLSWEWARELRRSLLAPAMQDYGAEVFIVSRSGDVLLGPKGSEGKKIAFKAYGSMLAGQASDPIQVWDDGVPYVTAVVATKGHGRYPGLGWTVVARQSRQLAFAEYERLQRELAVGALAAVFVVVLCTPWVARRLTSPLTKLTQTLARRSQGESVPIPRSAAYREAALLSNSLAEFTEREEQHLGQLREANESLEHRIEERTAEIRLREQELQANVEQLHESRERLQAITDNVPALIAEVDRDLRFSFVNQAHHDWFGVEPKALLGQPMSRLYGDVAMHHWSHQIEQVWQGHRVQFEQVRMVGSNARYELATYVPRHGPDGQVLGFYALVSDQTKSKVLELKLQNDAVHDALTGLPNRRFLMEQLPQAIARAERSRQAIALLFLDLNGFKGVNDTYGHEAGDELLKQVGGRLQALLRKTDFVVRLAGDEFVILLEPVKGGLDDARLVAKKVGEVISERFTLSRASVLISVSAGVSMYEPGCGLSVDQLLSKADSAMYAVKKGHTS